MSYSNGNFKNLLILTLNKILWEIRKFGGKRNQTSTMKMTLILPGISSIFFF